MNLLDFSSRWVIRCATFGRTAMTALMALCTIFTAHPVYAQSGAPSTTQGKFTLNGTPIEFRHAYASQTTSRRSGKVETFLILTDKPLSAKAISDESERGSAAQRDKINWIEIKLDDKRNVLSTYLEVMPLRGNVMSSNLKLTFDTYTEKALNGRFHSEREDRAFSHAYSFDLRFDALMAAPLK